MATGTQQRTQLACVWKRKAGTGCQQLMALQTTLQYTNHGTAQHRRTRIGRRIRRAGITSK